MHIVQELTEDFMKDRIKRLLDKEGYMPGRMSVYMNTWGFKEKVMAELSGIDYLLNRTKYTLDYIIRTQEPYYFSYIRFLKEFGIYDSLRDYQKTVLRRSDTLGRGQMSRWIWY